MERYQFHSKRLIDPKATENQKLYSKSWVLGFDDGHAKVNYSSLKTEKSFRKRIGQLSIEASVIFNGEIAGSKARIRKRKGEDS